MASPEAIAAAWATWHSRHGGKLGPGAAFSEAIAAALAVDGKALESAGLLAGLREADGLILNRAQTAFGDLFGVLVGLRVKIAARIAALEEEAGR